MLNRNLISAVFLSLALVFTSIIFGQDGTRRTKSKSIRSKLAAKTLAKSRTSRSGQRRQRPGNIRKPPNNNINKPGPVIIKPATE